MFSSTIGAGRLCLWVVMFQCVSFRKSDVGGLGFRVQGLGFGFRVSGFKLEVFRLLRFALSRFRRCQV